MGNKTVYLHIGTEKTGSTAIQKYLRENGAELERRGLRFVEASSGPYNHQRLYKALRGEQYGELLDEVVAEIEGSAAEKFVLTYESLYRLGEKKLEVLIDALNLAWVRVVAILYLRRRGDKFRSAFAYKFKSGHAPKVYGELLEGRFADSFQAYDYFKIVRKWEKALARLSQGGELVLRVYEPESLKSSDLIEDFMSHLGVLAADESTTSAPFVGVGRDVNPSIGPTAQCLAALISVLDLQYNVSAKIRNVLAQVGGADRKHSMVPDEFIERMEVELSGNDGKLARKYLGRKELFLGEPQFVYHGPDPDVLVALVKEIHKRLGALTSHHTPRK